MRVKPSPRKRWTKAEKWLLATPLLVAALVVSVLLKRAAMQSRSLQEAQYFGMIGSRQGALLSASGVVSRGVKYKGALFFWDLKSRKSFPAPTDVRVVGGFWTEALSLSPDAKRIAYIVDGSQLRVADRISGTLIWEKVASSHYIRSLTRFSPNGRQLAVTSVANAVYGTTYSLLGASNARTICSWTVPNLPTDEAAFEFSPDGQTMVSVGAPSHSPEESASASMSSGKWSELRRCRDGKLLHVLPLALPCPQSFSPDGKRVVVTAYPFFEINHPHPVIAACFDVETGREAWSIRRINSEDRRNFADVVFAPDGQSIAALDIANSQIVLWAATTGILKRTIALQERLSSFSTDSLFWLDAHTLFVRNYTSVQLCPLSEAL